jgi:hypothetical protein
MPRLELEVKDFALEELQIQPVRPIAQIKMKR